MVAKAYVFSPITALILRYLLAGIIKSFLSLKFLLIFKASYSILRIKKSPDQPPSFIQQVRKTKQVGAAGVDDMTVVKVLGSEFRVN